MNETKRQTRSYLMQLFEQHGFHPRGDLGQNFLIDLNLVEYIADQAELTDRDVVLEVGAGTGGLTTYLAQGAGAVVSVEYDRRMHVLAQAAVEGYDNVTLLQCDALKNKNHLSPLVLDALRQSLAAREDAGLKLVANLPFNIATPVVSNLLASDLPWTRMVVTIQYELGQRMIAKARTPHYGSLSVWVQSQCRVKLLKKLPPNVFWPRPRVDSAILRITPDRERAEQISEQVNDRGFFHKYVRGVFNHRRKLLRGVVYGMYRKQLSRPAVDRVLGELDLSAQQRAEEMDVATHVALAKRLRLAIEHDSPQTLTETLVDT